MPTTSSSEPLCYLRPGLILPAPAILAVLALERAGHRLSLAASGEHIHVERAPGVAVDPDDLAALRRWKRHAILLLRYLPSDEGRP